ncbi:hypothetical protein [Mycobacterium lacus]|uniref:Uncharacterized protein n=1 Tax=Mycobacterium lacus TaxID=169765 RepID=A0A1X1Y143_9MYCO|nr:hypothetical protein [Mycobacterium lacus]MCV7123298.1 hypothetical protein [Mycobacterium lacus]ORW04710.1 hypothetical protein AWC15_02895 [Mycobacterium lacus]BBX97076.1 hypothetical protein MLAC_23700 [Mycobacterium lacus]
MSISPQLGHEHRMEIPAGVTRYRDCGSGLRPCSFTASASTARAVDTKYTFAAPAGLTSFD